MTEISKVLKLDGTKIILLKLESDECVSCKQGFCNVKMKTFEAENPESLPLSEGDFVRVEIDSKITLIAVFLIFILPLALFALFYGLTHLIIPLASEGWKTGAGFLGLVAGFGLAALVGKFPAFAKKPVILEKVSSP